jgi:hypothetical protein
MSEPPGRTVKPPRTPVCCSCPEGPVLHKHADGSHWCTRCWGYAGYAGPNGVSGDDKFVHAHLRKAPGETYCACLVGFAFRPKEHSIKFTAVYAQEVIEDCDCPPCPAALMHPN